MRYTAKKIATMLLTMVIVSFLTFVAFSLLSGDAATRLLGTEATPERLEALRIELGLNDPLLVRYGRWLWDALRGDFGTSYRYGQSVSSLIAQRLGPTLTLTALAFALIVAVSIPLGVLSAKYAGGWLDRALTVINQVVMAVPPFFTGILFTYLFGLVLHLFIAGAFPAGGVGHYIGYLFFPALAVALPRIAMTVKLLRTSILDEAQRDYVRTSMSRGRSRSGILYRHVLKNTLVPVLTFLAMTVADLLAGSVVIEQVFAVPGLGRLLLTSIEGRDEPVARAIVVLLAFAVILCNLAADLLGGDAGLGERGTQGVDVRAEQAGRGQHRGGDGHALGDRLGGVADRVELGEDARTVLVDVAGHLRDALGVVREEHRGGDVERVDVLDAAALGVLGEQLHGPRLAAARREQVERHRAVAEVELQAWALWSLCQQVEGVFLLHRLPPRPV